MSSCGDGSIKVWDVAAPPQANPLRSFQEHGREVRHCFAVGAPVHACLLLVCNLSLVHLLSKPGIC